MEDRVLLDAAGLVTDLPSAIDASPISLASLDSPVVDTSMTVNAMSAVDAQASAQVDSELRISDKTLVFNDIQASRDNQLVISIAGGQLRFRDASGGLIGTTIYGALGSGTSAVSIPLSSLSAVDRLFVNAAGGDNTVAFDLSQNADQLLARFTTVRLEADSPTTAPSSLSVLFAGDRSTDLRYLPAANRAGQARVQLAKSSQSTTFALDATQGVDVTGMRLAEFVSRGSGRQRLELAEGFDSSTKTQDALAVHFTVPQLGQRTVQFYNNETVRIGPDPTAASTLQIVVVGAANNHQNDNLVLNAGSASGGSASSVLIDGPVALAGDLTVRANTFKVESRVQTLGVIDVGTSGDIAFSDFGSVQGRVVMMSSAGGLILNQVSSGAMVTGQQITLASARGIGTQNLPVRTRAGTLTLTVTGKGGIFVEEFDAVTVATASTNEGPIEITANGALTVQNRVSATASSDIRLYAQAGRLQIDGVVQSSFGDIDLSATGNVALSANAIVESASGAITLRPDIDNVNGGDLLVAGTVQSGSGTIVLWAPNAFSQVTGTIAGGGDVVKQGVGRLLIGTAGQWNHRGVTWVEQGVLEVNGRISASSGLRLADRTTLQGGGLVNAPVFSNSATAQIVATGNLRLGDGSAAGFDFGGTLIIQSGQTLTIRDADVAQLGRLTQLRNGATVIAAGGLEVGNGDRLTGSGTLNTTLLISSGGTLAPGEPVGVLRITDLTLQPGATLELDIRGAQPEAYDRLIVSGDVSVNQAVLQLNVGAVSIPPGAVFQLIENASPSAINGFFFDVRGTILTEGSQLRVGGIDASISYVGGTQLTGLVLSTRGQYFFVPLRAGGERYLTLFVPTATAIPVRPESDTAVPQRPVLESRSSVEVSERVVREVDTEFGQDVRLFFRIYDDATNVELDQEFNLDPELLTNLPSLFEKYRFPDGHYKIYLQEVGSERVRLVLDVHVYEGKVVPENYREAERPFGAESAAPPADASAEPAAEAQSDEFDVPRE